MVEPLREAKAHFSALVERASRGEEILITVHGKVKAKLAPAGPRYLDGAAWARELAALDEAARPARKN
jgi:prevent-host-death family protein